ncbi:unnamed protein product [Schistosoma mattheei]|uniref:Uncharacterized protein n=1 Tax=Schistosoma mattheei TaxID=31246 RepID=A0A183P5X0_9TREM|nr:unnamed protein product [Schistosoma mattheei]
MQLDDLNTSSGPSIPLSQTNAGHDKQCSRSLCISRPQHIQGKGEMLYYNEENTKSITLDGESLEDVETFTQHYQLTGRIHCRRKVKEWKNKSRILTVEEHGVRNSCQRISRSESSTQT